MDSDCFIVDQSSSANSDCTLPDLDFVKDVTEDEGNETVAVVPASETEDLDSFSLIEPPPLDWRSDSSSEAGSADDLEDSSMPPSADILTPLGESVMLPSLIPVDTNQPVLLKNKTELFQDLEVKLEKEHVAVKEVSAEGPRDEDYSEEDTFRDVEGNISKEVEDSCGRPGDEDHSHIHTLLTQLQLMEKEPCQRTSSYNRCSRLSEHHPPALSPSTNNITETTGLLFSESHQSDVLGLLQCTNISCTPQPSCLPHRGQVDAVVSVSYDQEDAQRFWGCDPNGRRHRDCSITSLPDDEYPEPVWMKLGEEPPEEDAAAEGTECADDQPSYKDVPGPCDPEDLLDGVIFGAKYLGSTQIKSDRNPSTNARMTQAQEAVDRIKAPEGESQPMTEVDLFISTQRIKVLNADTQEAMMDHALQTISYIADIGNIVVLMARRKLKGQDGGSASSASSSSASVCQKKCLMICHVFSSEDAQVIAQAIGQAFGVAYQQFLQASGIKAKDLKPGEYSDYLESQELYNGDLAHFSDSQNLRDIAITKLAGEILGLAVVESGWGSILPTVVVANLLHGGPAERCGELSIGDRIMSVNGTSLVGLPITTCENIIRELRNQKYVKLSIVHCPPVTMAIIRRPDPKFQLGFSVEDGIICSLMRGGIAERGGIRVGHRIIEINGQSVVATPHDKIIQILSNAVGEIHLKTMPASTYRLLTGQEQPVYL
uniref:Amyloid-beta A4 precursor protein-binding family A member 3 n=1 Tax=Nothobranchius kadleci TaxID=1051664 RepID=A0A1A8BYL4_NOTKA